MPSTDRRRAYLSGDISHAQYYEDLVAACSHILAEPVRSLTEATRKAGGDVASVPLSKWDGSALSLLSAHRPELSAIFNSRGDTVSLAGTVCLLKAAVRLELAD